MVLGDAVLKLETFVWILNYVWRSITWSLFAWKLQTWSNDLSQHVMWWWCQFIDWLKSETRPSSLLNFGTAYEVHESSCTSLTENNENLLHSEIITALQIGHLLLFGWQVFDSREILLFVRQFIFLSSKGWHFNISSRRWVSKTYYVVQLRKLAYKAGGFPVLDNSGIILLRSTCTRICHAW